jgi:hypothetical protein
LVTVALCAVRAFSLDLQRNLLIGLGLAPASDPARGVARQLFLSFTKGGEILMMMKNSKNNLVAFALVAAVAAALGWGASAIGSNQKTSAVAPQAELAPMANALTAPVEAAPVVSEPAAAIEAAPVVTAPPAKPAVKRSSAARSRTAVPAEETAAESRAETLPVRKRTEKEDGMGNGTKTAIAIGGGAATGAAIGAIAGGGKGAAIGALIGGGGGAVYSVIRKKQGKEVW